MRPPLDEFERMVLENQAQMLEALYVLTALAATATAPPPATGDLLPLVESLRDRSTATRQALAENPLDRRHPYRAHPKHPFFCADCGYPEDTKLLHLEAPAPC